MQIRDGLKLEQTDVIEKYRKESKKEDEDIYRDSHGVLKNKYYKSNDGKFYKLSIENEISSNLAESFGPTNIMIIDL